MEPKTLQSAIVYFSDPKNCREYLVARRWPDGVTCPRCGSKNVLFLEKYSRWHCREKHDAPQFTLKTGTIMEESPIGVDKWLTAMWQIVNCKNGISSYEVAKAIGVTQKSAWFMDHRIRLALSLQMKGFGSAARKKMGDGGKDGGAVEVDESFVGGKMRNMHRSRRARFAAEHGHTGGVTGKTVVLGMLDRNAREVRAKVVPDVKRETLQGEILKNVKYGTKVYTDDAVPYDKLHWRYVHEVVNHAEEYVRGQVHTNGMENFWSLMKRTLNGTYVAVEPFHLDRYLDEQMFRYNNRGTKDNPLNDAGRFDLAVRQIVGKRLTYDQLTGKATPQSEAELRS
jgi:transposase-like protein